LGGGSGCSSSARVKGNQVFGAAVEFEAPAGGFGDFLAEAHVVEAGFQIDDAEALRVELLGPDGADLFRVGEVGLDFLEVVGEVRGQELIIDAIL
jgi:hypothetical protein